MDSHQEALFQELGPDRSAVSGMDIDELDACVQERMADPDRRAELEAYFDAHPQFRDRAQAEIWDLDHNALWLLERDDADCLYLPLEEVLLWLPVFRERLGPLEARFYQAMERGDRDDAGPLRGVIDVLMQTARETVPAIFTRERVDRLVADLRHYRHDLMAAGEREAGMWAHAASLTLEHEDIPSENPLLIGICYPSLRQALIAAADEARSEAEGMPATEEAQARPQSQRSHL
jgi:hypothetical protein